MKNKTLAAAAAAALLGSAAAAPLDAQVASPSTAALGMGDNYTAAARGYAAVSWNPAGLALAGNPGWSLALITPRGIAGLGPITLADLAEWQGTEVPLAVRQRWLSQIEAQGGQSGTGGFDATWLALQVGPVAVQASTSARAFSNLTPGVARLLMVGNADDEGMPQVIDLAGSALNMNAYSAVGASYALPIALGDGSSRLAIGMTATYTVGHILAVGDRSTGHASVSPIALSLSFPLLHTPLGDDDDTFEANSGSGIGIDLGVGYEIDNLTFGLTVQNVINTFAWDADMLRYRPARLAFSPTDEFTSDFEQQPLATAPPALRALVDDLTFKPAVAAGAMLRHSRALTLSADARFSASGGLATRPDTHVGAGAEFRPVQWLPLRAGAAFVRAGDNDSGIQFGGGLGVNLAGYNLSAGVMQRSLGSGSETQFMMSMLSFGL